MKTKLFRITSRSNSYFEQENAFQNLISVCIWVFLNQCHEKSVYVLAGKVYKLLNMYKYITSAADLASGNIKQPESTGKISSAYDMEIKNKIYSLLCLFWMTHILH